MEENTPTPNGHTAPSEDTLSRRPARGSRDGVHFSSRSLLTWFIFGLLLFGLYFAYVLLFPFINTLVLAAVLAAICHPIYSRCLSILRGRQSLAALAVLFCVIILVVIPLVLFIVGLIPQTRQSVTAVVQWLDGTQLNDVFNARLDPVFAWLREHAPFLDITAEGVKADLVSASRRLGQSLIGLSTNLVGQTLNFFLHFLLFLLAMFFFLKDGAAMVKHIKFLTPLREEQEERIIQNLRRISKAVLVGGFLVAALQGTVGGLGLAFVGVPALFWGTVMAFSSLVPVLGTGLVWVPACLYLIVAGSWKSALFLAIWCGVGVTSIDTFLRPLLMRDASGIPLLFLFLAILGGLHAFGIFGLLYGPLILTFAVVMLKIYGDEYHDQLEGKEDC